MCEDRPRCEMCWAEPTSPYEGGLESAQGLDLCEDCTSDCDHITKEN